MNYISEDVLTIAREIVGAEIPESDIVVAGDTVKDEEGNVGIAEAYSAVVVSAGKYGFLLNVFSCRVHLGSDHRICRGKIGIYAYLLSENCNRFVDGYPCVVVSAYSVSAA